MATTQSTYTDAHQPFDNRKADIILRSSDNVDFRVFRSFLSFASPFFEAMFSLPNGQDVIKDSLAVIPFTECSRVLYRTLLFCYPPWAFDTSTLNDIPTLVEALKCSHKYDLEGVERSARALLLTTTQVEPLRVFCLACHHDLRDLAAIAARHTLRLPHSPAHIAELALITASTYHYLQAYHRRCGAVASAIATTLDWIKREDYTWFECPECRKGGKGTAQTISDGRRRWVFSQWWLDFMAEAATALADRPAGATVTEEMAVGKAVCGAYRCTLCGPKVHADMAHFCAAFAAEVDKVTAEIAFELPE